MRKNPKIITPQLINDCVVKCGLDLSLMAQRIGIGRSTLTAWCNGSRVPNVKDLIKLLDLCIDESHTYHAKAKDVKRLILKNIAKQHDVVRPKAEHS